MRADPAGARSFRPADGTAVREPAAGQQPRVRCSDGLSGSTKAKRPSPRAPIRYGDAAPWWPWGLTAERWCPYGAVQHAVVREWRMSYRIPRARSAIAFTVQLSAMRRRAFY